MDLGPALGRIMTIEEGVLAGGFGSAVSELYHRRDMTGVHVRIRSACRTCLSTMARWPNCANWSA